LCRMRLYGLESSIVETQSQIFDYPFVICGKVVSLR
jgi:hypothetical protein